VLRRLRDMMIATPVELREANRKAGKKTERSGGREKVGVGSSVVGEIVSEARQQNINSDLTFDIF
jgi:hypothetical protein